MRSIYKDIQRYTMNARIKVLWKQAESHTTNTSELRDRFAELIVRECMEVVDPGQNQVIARFQARQWLAEHFGVES